MPRFTREAKLLLAISGILSISFMGIQQLLRVLYVLRLGHGPEYVGLYGAAGAFTYMLMSLPSGAISVRLGMRTTMLIGGVIMALSMGILPLTEYLPVAMQYYWPVGSHMLLISGWSMFNVNVVPAMMVATTAETRSSVYAANGAIRGVGTFVGTLLGGLLPGLFAGLLGVGPEAASPYGVGLWVAAGISVFALAPIAMLKGGKPQRAAPAASGTDRFPFWAVAAVVLHVLFAHGGWATQQAFANAYLDTELHLSAAAIGIITSVAQAASVAAVLLLPRLMRRRSHSWMLLVTSLGMAITLVPLAITSHWFPASVGRIGVLALDAMWIPALQVFQMESVSPRWRALAYGASSMAMGLAFSVVSFGGGYVITAWGYPSVFWMGAALCAVGAGFSLLMPRAAKASRF
jgi:predicted MFS family arabinose efflux permease